MTNLLLYLILIKVQNPCFVLERKQYCAKYKTRFQLFCDEYATGDVATVYSYLGGQWDKVDSTEEIPGNPVE